MDTRPIKVLLVDDDEDDYILTSDLFSEIKGSEYAVEWAETYADALEAMQSGGHDVHLVDYHLGAHNGLELLREAMRTGCRAPVILLTGQSDKEVDVEAMKAGAADYLIKEQIDPPLLERSIRYAIERSHSLEALRKSEAGFRSVVQSASDAIVLADGEGQIILWNMGAEEIFGYDQEEILGQPLPRLIPERYQNVHQVGMEGSISINSFQVTGKAVELHGLRKDGREFPMELSLSTWKNGEETFYSGIIRDITDRKRAEQQLYYSAFHDALTNLPNRALFIDYLDRVIARTKQRKEGQRERQFAVLFLDLDRFKIINDSLGHTIGDQLLVAVARRLETSLRLEDRVARIGGDEFTILLADIENSGEATIVADRVARDLSRPFNLGGHEVVTTASIGIAPSVIGYTDPSSILRDADMAMYRAKSLGKSRYEIFDKTMHVRAVNLLQLETDLRRAVEREEFLLHYQPIVELASGVIRGFEALVRWQHPERGMVSPGEFIPVAEETRLIIPIGEWVLREACRQVVRWQERASASEPLWMSVNLSIKQFTQPSLPEQVGDILRETNLDPRSLKLEITESLMMENIETAIGMLWRLRALGIELSIDDFGTGYSSLSYLHRFPLSTLKIDRSFVSNMDEGNENTEIVRTVITLARSLGMQVVAEGVETEEQLLLLKTLGCEYGQGYLFSRPMDAEAASEMLNKNHAHAARASPGGAIGLSILDLGRDHRNYTLD